MSFLLVFGEFSQETPRLGFSYTMERSSDDSGLSGKKVDLQKILNWSLSLQNLGEDGKTNDAIESVENRSERLVSFRSLCVIII